MPVHKVGNCRADMCSLKTVFLHHLPSFDLDPSPSMYFVYLYGVQCFSPSLEKTHLRALVFPHLLFLSDSMSLIVIDVVFLVAGLPSIVSAHLGFQDLVFGDLTSRLFFIARGCLHGLLISFCLFLSLCSLIDLITLFFADLLWLFLSPYLLLQVWIVFFFVYALYAWKVFYGLKLKHWFFGGWVPFSPTRVVYLLLIHSLV
ncbi:hypothetical protein F2Q69_00011540 [Brassica cretica]|uniref:Uncharacterized protein n=1 Tax=Brassica cretica TaxID=69181 RepID=A0A8S9QUD7_BRACR|nr:hypothetical protein F2Q69_00011540 [Brassica cretica]